MAFFGNKKNIFAVATVLAFFIYASYGHQHDGHVVQDGSCSKPDEKNLYSIIKVGAFSAIIFAIVGTLPALFIRTDADEARFVNSKVFKCLLAFAAGSLLAEVFLHLIPESMENASEPEIIRNGLNTIGSFFIFLTIEKFTELIPNAHALGTLNLIANVVDNSAHGTTVVGSFQNSVKFGIIALLATVIHEVPHEFADFALLLRDGYPRKAAIWLQLATSMAGTIGATIAFAMASDDISSCVTTGSLSSHHVPNHKHGSTILPFTIGGFLYIALVGIVPEIIKEEDRQLSFLQLISLLIGVVFIYWLTQMETFLFLTFA